MKSNKYQLSFKFVFIFVFIVELCNFVWQILSHRISAGHDTIQYFLLQYYFLNHLVCHGEIPQWMPHMTQGTVATWWFSIQAGFFQNTLIIFHSFIKNINFATLFTIGVFWEHLFLLCGIWLWGRIHLKSPWALLFFCSSIMGSAIWMNQIWYNFHLYYALPLIFFFVHKFLQTAQTRWISFAGQLWLLQSFANMPYFLPMTGWILFSYFAFFLIQQPKIFFDCLKRIKYLNLTFTILILIITGWFYIFVTTHGTDQIVNYNPGRNLKGTTDLNGFLTYGGTLQTYSWLEALSGISPMMDYTLYCGALVIPLALSSFLFSRSLRSFAWIIIWTVLLILLNLSLWPAGWLYEWWPMMKYYRHLSLLAPISKMAVCFLAAIVLDYCLEHKLSDFQIKKLAALSCGMIAGMLLFFFQKDGLENIIALTISPNMFFREVHILHNWSTPSLSPWSHFRCMILIFTLIGLTTLIVRPIKKAYILSFLIIIHIVDIYSYKTYETLKRTVTNTESEITRFQPVPFSSHRSIHNWKEYSRSAFITQLPLESVKNWVINSFIYFDEPGSTFRVDHWLKPYDQYLRTYWGQTLNKFEERPLGLINFQSLIFPASNPSALKFSAVTESKIQFFTHSFDIPEVTCQSQIMHDLTYTGDTPLITKGASDIDQNLDLTKNSRIKIPYHILDFSANRIIINLDNPKGLAKWLVYSDIWHPDWRAFDNGQRIPIERANLAYKAVPLSSGNHFIEFQFFSQKVNILIWGLAWLSLLWVCGIIFLTVKIIFQHKLNNEKPIENH